MINMSLNREILIKKRDMNLKFIEEAANIDLTFMDDEEKEEIEKRKAYYQQRLAEVNSQLLAIDEKSIGSPLKKSSTDTLDRLTEKKERESKSVTNSSDISPRQAKTIENIMPTEKKEQESKSPSETPIASKNISEAIDIIESIIDIKRDFVTIKSSGLEGKSGDAIKKFQAEFLRYPENPIIHYAYASCLHFAMQYKTAEVEMRKCAIAHPDFILAKLALDGWSQWRNPFTLPPWGANIEKVHPVLSQWIKTSVLLSVRDGILPRAAIFIRDNGGDFQDIFALRYTITIDSVISSVKDPQVIGNYTKIYDDPNNPYIDEILQTPFRPRGNSTRSMYEYLCIQKDIDVVIIDKNDRILLNKRVSISREMQLTNDKIFKMLAASDGREISNSELVSAILQHQQNYASDGREIPTAYIKLFLSPIKHLSGTASIMIDEELTWSGSFKTGINKTLAVSPGSHIVKTKILFRSRTYHIEVEIGQTCVIELEYSRTWGNFTKKPRLSKFN